MDHTQWTFLGCKYFLVSGEARILIVQSVNYCSPHYSLREVCVAETNFAKTLLVAVVQFFVTIAIGIHNIAIVVIVLVNLTSTMMD